MIEARLDQFRKKYLATHIPGYLMQEGWLDLQSKMRFEPTTRFQPLYSRGLIFASSLILVVLIVLGASQTTKPGDLLFPIKVASDNLISKVTGNLEFKIQRRAQEVIDLSSDSQASLEDANRAYQQTLEEAKKEAEETGQNQEFKNTLDQQEERFRQAQRGNPSSQRGLEEAIKHTEQVKGEVKGQKDEKSPDDKNKQGNSNN